MSRLSMPVPIVSKIGELNQLVTENPEYIPTTIAAQFLHMDAGALRDSIERECCPFGFLSQKGINRAFKIPTLTFYLWYTNGKFLI